MSIRARGRSGTERPLAAAVAAIVVSACLPTTAGAEVSAGPTALVTLPGSQAARGRADQVASAIARGLEGQDLMEPDAVRERFLGDGGAEAVSRAARRARRARQELEAFEDLEHTARLLERAAESHVAILPILDGVHDAVGLFVDVATVALAMGDEERVAWALGEALRLDPALDLDPSESPGRLVRAVDDTRRERPDLLLLSAERARHWAERLDAAQLLVVQPHPGPRHIAVELYGARSGELVDRWVIGASEADRVVAELRGRAPREPVGGSDPPLEPDPGDDPHIPVEPPPPPPRAFEWYRQWWVWTLVGVAVAGIAAGAAIAIVEGQTAPQLGVEVMSRW